MNTIYFKHGAYSAGTITWSSSQTLSVPLFIAYDEAERITDKDVRGSHYSHLLFSKITYEVKISANDLTNSTKWLFLQNFYKADAWKISTDNWTSETIVVLEEAGRMPVEFLEGNKNIREITLHLIQKEPD